MVIDESPPPPPPATPTPVLLLPTTNSNYNNNEIKINNFGQGFANAVNICQKDDGAYPTHTVKLDPTSQQPLFYPFTDFSLPFSLSSLLQRKKSEMAAILVPRVHHHEGGGAAVAKLTLEHLTKAALALKSPISPPMTNKASPSPNDSLAMNNNNGGNSGSANNTQVSEYEHQIQNDLWPIDCIKCSAVLHNLDNFNIHMNDHWSDDKCCPVCGLLINSKRFNFKQHLKIHTGEKPFVCQVCSRAFRQKAHMVKHVTTHRSEPRTAHDLSFQPGVIVQ
jgi:hypothetical protein